MRRTNLAIAFATIATAVALASSPGQADSTLLSIPNTAGNLAQVAPGTVLPIGSAIVPASLIGRECPATLTLLANPSTNLDTQLRVTTGGKTYTWENVERNPNSVKGVPAPVSTFTIILGPDIKAEFVVGPWGWASGGLTISEQCPPVVTTTSSTTTSTTTTVAVIPPPEAPPIVVPPAEPTTTQTEPTTVAVIGPPVAEPAPAVVVTPAAEPAAQPAPIPVLPEGSLPETK